VIFWGTHTNDTKTLTDPRWTVVVRTIVSVCAKRVFQSDAVRSSNNRKRNDFERLSSVIARQTWTHTQMIHGRRWLRPIVSYFFFPYPARRKSRLFYDHGRKPLIGNSAFYRSGKHDGSELNSKRTVQKRLKQTDSNVFFLRFLRRDAVTENFHRNCGIFHEKRHRFAGVRAVRRVEKRRDKYNLPPPP